MTAATSPAQFLPTSIALCSPCDFFASSLVSVVLVSTASTAAAVRESQQTELFQAVNQTKQKKKNTKRKTS